MGMWGIRCCFVLVWGRGDFEKKKNKDVFKLMLWEGIWRTSEIWGMWRLFDVWEILEIMEMGFVRGKGKT